MEYDVYCYPRSCVIVSDLDDDLKDLLSSDLVCDGNCRRCPEPCVISSARGGDADDRF